MAKGDQQRSQTSIDQLGGRSRQDTTSLYSNFNNQNQQRNNEYTGAMQEDANTRHGLQGNYEQTLGNIRTANQGMPGNFAQEREGYQNFANGLTGGYGGGANVDDALKGYRDFAQTGGFSDQNLSDLRARAISPTRAIYGNAQANIDRQRSIQGGYSPNYTAASSKLARDMSSQIGDQNVNANASIAQAVQQGKLAGLTGLSTTELAQAAQNLQGQQLSNQARLSGLGGMTGIDEALMQGGIAGRNQELGALGGMRDLYGTSPGLSGQAGGMLNNSNSNLLGVNNQQNDLNLGLINAQQNQARIPSDYSQGIGNIGGMLGLIGQGARFLPGMFPGGGPGTIDDPGVTGGVPNSLAGTGGGGNNQPNATAVPIGGNQPGMISIGGQNPQTPYDPNNSEGPYGISGRNPRIGLTGQNAQVNPYLAMQNPGLFGRQQVWS